MRRLLVFFFVGLALLVVTDRPAAAQSIAYTDGPGNLRAGPARDYPLVATLPPGTQVQIFGCTDDWMWCDVNVGPNRGWLYARHLDYPYQGRRVLIFGHGPSLGLPIVTFAFGNYWDTYYRGRPWYGRRSYWASRPPPPRPIVRPVRPIRPGRPPAARPPHAGPGPGHRPPPSAHRPPPSGARPRPHAPPRTPQHDRGGDRHHN